MSLPLSKAPSGRGSRTGGYYRAFRGQLPCIILIVAETGEGTQRHFKIQRRRLLAEKGTGHLSIHVVDPFDHRHDGHLPAGNLLQPSTRLSRPRTYYIRPSRATCTRNSRPFKTHCLGMPGIKSVARTDQPPQETGAHPPPMTWNGKEKDPTTDGCHPCHVGYDFARC